MYHGRRLPLVPVAPSRGRDGVAGDVAAIACLEGFALARALFPFGPPRRLGALLPKADGLDDAGNPDDDHMRLGRVARRPAGYVVRPHARRRQARIAGRRHLV